MAQLPASLAMGQLDAVAEVDWKALILHHLAPGLGCIIAFGMFVSPLKAVLQVRKDKYLGDLNPLPLIAIIANCTGWLLYGCINRDPYVIAANEPGFLLGVFMSVSCYGFAEHKVREQMLHALMFFSLVITSTSVYLALAVAQHAQRVQLAGYLAVGILLIYYAAPLSVLAKVLTTKSSAALYWPLSVMSCVNGSLWVCYGLAVNDYFIWVPNGVGVVLGLVQLILIAIFPAKKSRASYAASDAGDDAPSAREPLVGGRGDDA